MSGKQWKWDLLKTKTYYTELLRKKCDKWEKLRSRTQEIWEGTNNNALYEPSVSLNFIQWGKLSLSWKKTLAGLMTSAHSYLTETWCHIITKPASVQKWGNLVQDKHSIFTQKYYPFEPSTCRWPDALDTNLQWLGACSLQWGAHLDPPKKPPKADTSAVHLQCSSALGCQGFSLITMRNICTWGPVEAYWPGASEEHTFSTPSLHSLVELSRNLTNLPSLYWLF